ncbi:LytR/AlgR family response regulator transcription factor [Tenacibaculum sp. ZS6-P6]|uniref:LytR/AlgR family response regulator transcription factor n=1 Tax=Tenacibaculum sp. ZS6-P6 TaxID=3447503 RepID=UPI003F9AE138
MKNDFTFIKTNRKFIKIKFEEIAYIKGLGNYVEIVTINKQKYIYYKSLKELIENLPNEFLRIQNSYIVNLVTIDSYQDNQIVIGEFKISVGKSYRECLKETIEKLLL